MPIYALKSRFQDRLRPAVQRLAQRGVSANQVTIAAFLGSLIVALLVALGLYHKVHWVLLIVPLWMCVRMAMNAMDGMLAREHDQQTRLGAYLNELTDIASDAALFLPFALLSGVNAWLLGAVIWLAALVETAGILGASLAGERHYHGPMGKSDRAFVFGVLSVWVVFFGVPGMINALWCLLLVLLTVSLVRRIRAGL